MGLHMPQRVRRVALGSSLAIAPFALSGCSSNDILYLQIPSPITTEGHLIHEMWTGSWAVLWIVGAIVWAMMGYVSVKYRRRSEADVPVQVRYHLPIEIFYTLVPVMMVIVMFFFTVKVQNKVVDVEKKPDYVVNVVGFQWSWAFNYLDAPGVGDVYEGGTTASKPTLWLVKDKRVEFSLTSPDVIHSFWVPAFIFKLDVVPGRDNRFQVTPDTLGEFDGRCAELCGVYHSRMLFNVKVVSQDEFDKHMQELKDKGNIGRVTGGTIPSEVAGLNSEGEAK